MYFNDIFSSCIYIQVVLSRASTAEILETGPTAQTPNSLFLSVSRSLFSSLSWTQSPHLHTYGLCVWTPCHKLYFWQAWLHCNPPPPAQPSPAPNPELTYGRELPSCGLLFNVALSLPSDKHAHFLCLLCYLTHALPILLPPFWLLLMMHLFPGWIDSLAWAWAMPL